jgi:hypothetical protein
MGLTIPPTFKAFEEGSETMSKEANSQLALFVKKVHTRFKECIIPCRE